MSVTVCIPSCGKHLHHLRKCLDSIEAQTVKPAKVIVSCSSTIFSSLRYDSYSFPVVMLMTTEPKNAGENRNRAVDQADTEFITMIDVDDTMHHERIEFILQAFSKPCDIVLHAFTWGPVSTGCLNPFIFYDGLETAPTGCTMVKGSRPVLETIPIQHAHVSFRRSIFNRVRFPEEVEHLLRADSIFCGRVLNLPDVHSAYIANPLTSYIPTFSAYEASIRPVVFCFWISDTPLSDAQVETIERMKSVTDCDITLITKNTLSKHVLRQLPLHSGYERLDDTQKSEYLRAYFMHFYGQGYSDIKEQSGSWLPAFQQFYESDAHLSEGNGVVICRPQTPYTEKLYNDTMIKLGLEVKGR